MFKSFLGMLGGLGFAGWYAWESLKDLAYEQEQIERKARINRMKEKLVDDDLEDSIKKYVYSGNHVEEIKRKLCEDFKFVFGNDWEEKICLPGMCKYSGEGYNRCSHGYWTVHLLLSKKGKCGGFEHLLGYLIGGIATAQTDLRFMQCIEKNLNMHHAEVNLVFRNTYGATTIYGGHMMYDHVCSGAYPKLWAKTEN